MKKQKQYYKLIKYWNKKLNPPPGMNDLAKVLFNYHTHADICPPDEVVYTHKSVCRILRMLGHGNPTYGRALREKENEE